MSAYDFILGQGDWAPGEERLEREIANLSPLGTHIKTHELGNSDEWRVSGSGLVVPSYMAPARQPLHVDAFCGAGGFGLGMVQAGFRTVAAFDNDINAAITYMHNLCSYPCKIIVPDPKLKENLERELEKWIFGQDKTKNLQWLDKHAGQGYISNYPQIPGCPFFF